MNLLNHFILISLLMIGSVTAQEDQTPDINSFTANMEYHAGFYDFYWDNQQGKIYLKVDRFDQDLLYAYYLQSGVGSNDVGLDRGQIGSSALVQFKRLGNKVLMIEPNQRYRAYSDNPAEQQAVADGFAQSVLFGGVVVAQDQQAALVDWTDFLLRDSQGISERLAQLDEGQFKIDPNRSAIYMDNSKNFPQNTEFEALITLQGSQPGKHIRSVAPTHEIISVRTHHSLIQLPEVPYKSREFDPRSGGIPITFYDYAAPLNQPMKKQWVVRHRLEKQNPEAAISDPVEPIIYYLDSGTPEPVRSALLDGAKWWSKAFEAAGFSNAFQVQMLPEGADPLDVRYNTIQWVHRATRGWSYGASLVDPRSGEILKGHVTLGSLRVRQDMLIAQGLLSPYHEGANTAQLEQDIQAMALARLRQLSAHEVGHTLGLIHNFNASSNQRSSVMDYPHPLVKITASGAFDLSDAYGVGIGSWDTLSLRYLYQDFAGQDEQVALNDLLTQGIADGHVLIADRDARDRGGSHPFAHLWDNGQDAAQGLLDVMAVRKKALEQLGLNTLKAGQAVSDLERHLVPIYLFHRYQTEAAVKLVAGVDYRYAMKGEGQVQAQMLDPETQLRAMDALMTTLDANHLAVPERLLPLLLPPAAGSLRDREHFNHRTGPNFDALGVVESAATHTLSLLLHVERANRLVEHHARDQQMPSLEDVLNLLWENTWGLEHKNRYLQAVQMGINWTTLSELIRLSNDEKAAPLTRATLLNFLQKKKKVLERHRKFKGFNQMSVSAINHLIFNPAIKTSSQPQSIPPGSPIGSHQEH